MLPSFYLIERDLWLLLDETFFAWWNVTFFFSFFIYFCLLIFLMYIFFALPLPFLKQPSIQRCASCCKPCDHLENASFETYNPRRSWRAIVLSETHWDARASISLSRLVRGPRRSYGCTWRSTEINFGSAMLQTVRPFRKCWFWNIQFEEVMARHSSVRDP